MADRPPPKMGPGRRMVFRPDHKSFGEFILSEQMRGVTAEVAKDISDRAKEFTPTGDGSDGHMKDKYEVERQGGVLKVDRSFRVMVLVVNTDARAAAVEFGGRFNKRRRPLGRAGGMFGDFKHGKKGGA